MKSVFNNLLLFITFLAASTLLAGCSGGSVSTSGAVNGANGAETARSAGSTNPPLASDLADAEFELIDGTKMKISDRKGKVVFLNLWATWCGPCRAEMPHLIEMQDKYGSQGFQIIGLDIGNDDLSPESVEDIKGFAKNMKLNYELARIPAEMTLKFNKISRQAGVPQSFLLDREGRLRGVFVGGGSKAVNSFKETIAKVMAE